MSATPKGGASSVLKRVSLVGTGAVVAFCVYHLWVKPLMDRHSVGRFEEEARQVYALRQRKLERQQEYGVGVSDDAGRDNS